MDSSSPDRDGYVHQRDGSTTHSAPHTGMNAGSAINSACPDPYHRDLTGRWGYNPVASPLSCPKVRTGPMFVPLPMGGGGGYSFGSRLRSFLVLAVLLFAALANGLLELVAPLPVLGVGTGAGLPLLIFALVRYRAVRHLFLVAACGEFCALLSLFLFSPAIERQVSAGTFLIGAAVVSLGWAL